MKLITSALVLLLFALGMVFFYAPEEVSQGPVQKIFYFHVASAIVMYVGFFISFLTAVLYLIEKKENWDAFSVSGAKTGFFLCTIVLLTGPIWAKPIWGAWWTWEPRLTTTLLLWLLYAAYLVLRGYFATHPRGKTFAAVVAIIAFLDVPLVHLSVRLWRGIHPSVIGKKGGGLPESMQITLWVSVFAMLVFFFALFLARFRLEKSRQGLIELKLKKTERI